jgi:hypothetical protein
MRHEDYFASKLERFRDGSPQDPAITGAMAKTDQGSELEFGQRLTGGDWRGDPQWRAREV